MTTTTVKPFPAFPLQGPNWQPARFCFVNGPYTPIVPILPKPPTEKQQKGRQKENSSSSNQKKPHQKNTETQQAVADLLISQEKCVSNLDFLNIPSSPSMQTQPQIIHERQHHTQQERFTPAILKRKRKQLYPSKIPDHRPAKKLCQENPPSTPVSAIATTLVSSSPAKHQRIKEKQQHIRIDHQIADEAPSCSGQLSQLRVSSPLASPPGSSSNSPSSLYHKKDNQTILQLDIRSRPQFKHKHQGTGRALIQTGKTFTRDNVCRLMIEMTSDALRAICAMCYGDQKQVFLIECRHFCLCHSCIVAKRFCCPSCPRP